jgi:hypothetical protein
MTNSLEFSKWVANTDAQMLQKLFTQITKARVNTNDSGSVKRYFDAVQWIERLNSLTSDGGVERDAKAYLRGIWESLPGIKNTWVGGE